MADTNGKVYEKELQAAVLAAQEAAKIIGDRAGSIEEESVRAKGLNDLVTEVDEEVQELIIRSLQETFPASKFLAEEGEDFSSSANREGYLWIIDPIDGTTNFLHGVPPYAVSIALQHDDDLAVAVVLDASSGEIFTATKGGGLFVNGSRQTVSRTQKLGESLITTGFPYREVAHIDQYLDVLGEFMRRSRGVRRPGSASVDLAYVASGRFDGFFETGLKPWDVAAGMLLVQEGGGRVSNYRNEPNPVFEEQILASNGAIHGEMLSVLGQMKDVHL